LGINSLPRCFLPFFGNWSLLSCSEQSTTENPFMYICLFQEVSSLYRLQLACCRHFASLPRSYFFCNFFYRRLSHIHVCAHLLICTNTHTHTSDTHTPTPTPHTHTHTHTHARTHTHTQTHMRADTHTCARARTHTHTHTHAQTHTTPPIFFELFRLLSFGTKPLALWLLDCWMWDHYIVSKCWVLITQWHNTTVHKNGDPCLIQSAYLLRLEFLFVKHPNPNCGNITIWYKKTFEHLVFESLITDCRCK